MFGRKWFKSSVPSTLPDTSQDSGVHVYLFWTRDEGGKYLVNTLESVTAEELCILAAETVGINPLCHVLFALYNPKEKCWYNPNHIFSIKENCRVEVCYCMRFYFRNWHGLNDKEPTVFRYALKSGTDQTGSPLFDITTLEYLFAQAKHDFVNEVMEMEPFESDEEVTRFKNESLGMAVLHLSHLAIQEGLTLQEVAGKVSFKKCIPRSFATLLSNDNVLTKIRIQRVFSDFVKTFQQQTAQKGQLGTHEIMCKYISTLEHLVPSFSTETFLVAHLVVRKDGDGRSFFSTMNCSEDTLQNNFTATHEITVSGTKGIHWRKADSQKAQSNNYLRCNYLYYTKRSKQHSSQANEKAHATWTFFCDFPEITHIDINGANVHISTQDSGCMEVQMKSSQQARSFISLLDGYYRLTADAYHYLCREVAPPRVVLSEANLLHGPMHDDFVLHKLKKKAAEEGTFLVRWSNIDYKHIILAVLNKNESLKQFRILYKNSVFHLENWDRVFFSLKEMTRSLENFVLSSGNDNFSIKKCCVPRPGEISNLLVKRHSIDHSTHSESFHLDLTELRFQPIKDKMLIQGEHLGRGTRTNIYSGRLLLPEWKDDDTEFNNNNLAKRKGIHVVLKILDQSDKDIALAFFETASLMSQVTHSHLVFVHGVSLRGSENIMVEEYVEFGPLDVFLRKERASINTQWKFLVAIQLARALNYLETKCLVHGNVCAKNILVARRGLDPETSPFVKLSDPGIALNALTRQERLARIPWIAPECIDGDASVGNTADQWSFGVTLLEICNNGDLPMSGLSLTEKERFYQNRGRLAEPSSQELATFISMCLTYEPDVRPSFRTVLRDLTEIMMKNPDIISWEPLASADPGMFQKRYLKMYKVIGEGHFGKVTLCRYDPTNDDTGEFVAVKSLKQEDGNIPESWFKEIEILKSLDHCNIVKYKGCCSEPGSQEIQLIMEYLPMGSLREYLPKHNISMPQVVIFGLQICLGMDYLHSRRYVHRDLAARNVLIAHGSLLKIGDFGLTKHIPEGERYYRVHENGDSPVYWYAIECLKEMKFSFASDVWSFGVTLYEILTQCDPRQSPPTKFGEMMKAPDGRITVMLLIDLLEKNQRLPSPRQCPQEMKLVMEQCWNLEASNRPSFKILIEKFEAMHKMYRQFNTNFSMSQIC